MNSDNIIKVGIGFATGRKSFQKVLRSYIHNWNESGLVENKNVLLNIFVAYDLSYNQTKRNDYINIHPELTEKIDGSIFIGKNSIKEDIKYLINKNIITSKEAGKIFGKGYASQRNAVLYSAIKHGMDYLIFLDDDEYPVAVTNTRKSAIWGGQQVLSTHIKFIKNSDITHGHHCGYISPIPYIKYNDIMTEDDFRVFIQAISNDILNWDNIKAVMENGGVTYADTKILTGRSDYEVDLIGGAKFISGSNLGINLTKPHRVLPFYNPKGARGEDTFLSTCLSERTVIKVPCYTFHDGFSTYHHLLEGVLPIKLKPINSDEDKNIERFYKACIGWIRYKPLLLYITQNDSYDERIAQIRKQLTEILPKVCAYFNRADFMNISDELEKYNKNVIKHYKNFTETKLIWSKIMEYFEK
ncbi:MAG: hypothetical protein AAGU14_10155 [Eubacteriaceae bacterium]